jgi:dynein heavy chain
VEEAMKEGTPGVKKYWNEVLNAQLKDLVVLVRQKLSTMVKIAVNALIVIDVHAKDVVENLWRNDVSDLNAFEWIS